MSNDPPPLSGSPLQLTFSAGDDLNPSWSPNSDTVYYTAWDFIDYPGQQTSIVRIGRTGGAAQLVVAGAPSQNLMLPVRSPQGGVTAYVQLGFINTPARCDTIPSPACRVNEPLLEAGNVRVRTATASAGASFDSRTPIPIPGVDVRRTEGRGAPYFQNAFPFQVAFRERGEMPFRPSWSPDGTRLVFSDGVALHTWTPSVSEAAVRIPNTVDGVSPAWSPDGSTIAFTRLARGDSSLVVCQCREVSTSGKADTITDFHNRWTYTAAPGVIALIKPDGTGPITLTQGVDPAWSPDGATLYFVRDNQIFRIARSGGPSVAIAETTGGRTPAVSPDGRWLAFTRGVVDNGVTMKQDIWIIDLTKQQ